MEIRDIYLYVCINSFYYGTFARASTSNLHERQTAPFTRAGVAMTDAADSSLHTHTIEEKEAN